MPATEIPLDGRLTSLQVLNVTLTGGEAMEIVSPGNAETGDNYQVTTAVLAAYFASYPFVTGRVLVTATPYSIGVAILQVLVDLAVAAPVSVVAPLAVSMTYPYPVLIKDFGGDASDVNPITVTFTGGELCDGLSSLTIQNPYGWVRINPNIGGGGWYMS